MNRLLRLALLYTVLIFGFLCVYILDLELIIYGEENTKPSSKTNFVYQQF